MVLIRSIPFSPMSSRRPTNGLTKYAPAFAAMIAWGAEKTSVTFTRIRSLLRILVAFSPSFVIGHFTTMFGCSFARCLPSSTMPAASRLTVSALTGPSTSEQILSSWSSKLLPSFEISVGFVVIPSKTPVLAASRISSMLAVSRKNFMLSPFCHCSNLLWTTKRRAHWTFVSRFVDSGDGIIQARPVRRIEKPDATSRAIRNRLESLVRSFTAEHTISGKIGFGVRLPGHVRACLRCFNVKPHRNSGRRRIFRHNCGRLGANAHDHVSSNTPGGRHAIRQRPPCWIPNILEACVGNRFDFGWDVVAHHNIHIRKLGMVLRFLPRQKDSPLIRNGG